MKQIDSRVQSLDFKDTTNEESKLHAENGNNTNDKTHLAGKPNISTRCLLSSQNPSLKSNAISSIGSKNVKVGLPKLDRPTAIIGGRVVSPLLDLH